MPAALRSFVRASLGPVNGNGFIERCRSIAETCVRQRAIGAVLFVEGGKPHYVAVRRAMHAMVTAGAPGHFRMALVAATAEDYRTCRYIEAVAQRCALQAKTFFGEHDAVSWMNTAGEATLRAERP